MKTEDRIKSFSIILSVLATICLLLGFNLEDKSSWDKYYFIRWILGGLLCIAFLSLFFIEWIAEKWFNRIMRKRHLLGTIISRKTTRIEIINSKGTIAKFFQKIHFSKIKNGAYVNSVNSDIDIEDSFINIKKVQLANCSIDITQNNKHLRIYFQDNIELLNKKASLFPVDKFLYFSTELINSFTNLKQDSWVISTFNYCKEYELRIVLPRERKIIKMDFYKENGSEKIIDAVNPILLRERNREIIYLYITNFDKKDKYILKWAYKN
ncbi:MAG: hypothetical protein K2X39_00115 [Silvanigrellaceae bacterium]|nr:hypothetical protein [Silvanigrellaceae bacterium]